MASHDQVEHVSSSLRTVPKTFLLSSEADVFERARPRQAREVAASHESRPEDNVPGRVLHSEGEKLAAAVEEK